MPTRFEEAVVSVDKTFAKRIAIEILQVNVGNVCNQRCVHCHVSASPEGDKVMSRKIMDDVVKFLTQKKGLVLDITGGCPELNPDLMYLIEEAAPFTKKITIRNNLTIFFEEGMKGLPQFYKKNKIKLICSLPCYTKGNVEKQRGDGVFDKSIEALKMLNDMGYGKHKDLEMDLVYNPGGAFLPGDQLLLEKDYRKMLGDDHGIVFDHLLTITNAPIKRFEEYLRTRGDFDAYMRLLIDNFNRDVAGNIMCRDLLSVGWDGALYDCDFNQALGLGLKDVFGKSMNVMDLNPKDFDGMNIIFKDHCFCCTAGSGSSCSGYLKK